MNGQLYNEGSASRMNVPALKLALVSFLTGGLLQNLQSLEAFAQFESCLEGSEFP